MVVLCFSTHFDLDRDFMLMMMLLIIDFASFVCGAKLKFMNKDEGKSNEVGVVDN